MDELLKRVADAGLHVSAAEEAVADARWQGARDEIDAAEDILSALRERWPQLGATERTLLGRMASPLRARLDAAQRALPRTTALVVVEAESDPEEDAEPGLC
jgi:hypothetical protein